MSENVINDNHKPSMADIYNSMSVEQRGLFDADIATAWACGEEVGSMNQNSAMLAMTMTPPQQELLIKMRQKAFEQGRMVGQLRAAGKSNEEIAKELHIPLKKIKKLENKEEDTNGSSSND